MSGNQIAHQVFRITIPTLIPSRFAGFDGLGFLEGYRNQILSVLTQQMNTALFISNGFQQVQSVSIANLNFIPGNDGNAVIQYDADIKSDPTFLTIAEILGVLGGIVAAITGILTGNLILTAIGVTVIIAVALISAQEIIHEVTSTVSTSPQNIGIAIVIIVAIVIGFVLMLRYR
jgi:hypothetical protein